MFVKSKYQRVKKTYIDSYFLLLDIGLIYIFHFLKSL